LETVAGEVPVEEVVDAHDNGEDSMERVEADPNDESMEVDSVQSRMMLRARYLLSGLIVWRFLRYSGVDGFDFGCIDTGVWFALFALSFPRYLHTYLLSFGRRQVCTKRTVDGFPRVSLIVVNTTFVF
jgi:hypothetical protein